MTIKSELDRLIDSYVLHKQRPDVISVNCRPRTLRKFAKDGLYRGYSVKAIKPKRVKREQLEMPQ